MQSDSQEHQPKNPIAQALASALKLSPQDVLVRNRSSQTLRQIASTQGVEFSDVQDALTAAAKSAVSGGELSEQQGQSLLSLVADPTFGSTTQSTHQLLRGMHGRFDEGAG